MVSLSLKTLDGGTKTIDAEDLESLRGGVRGTVCLPGEAGYDAASAIWNAMIDRRPGLVVCCAGAADVMRAVRFARANGLLVAVRGGGHNIAGNAICDGGLMIDLSPMRSIRVDPTARKAWVGPGATLGDLDKETQAFGLAVPTGINSTTGVAGLTLGGGFGWITRKFGLTIDTLLSADVVTADGELVRASEKANSDLFWALRGGGGNFGIVTCFEFQLHPVGPQVLAGLIVHPFADAPDLLRAYRRIVADAPDELTCWVVMRKAPPLPFLNEEWHGREVLVFALCYAGDLEKGEKAVAPLRALGKPIADVVGPQPFTGWQSAFDPLLTPGARNYWKSHDFVELSDPAIEVILEYAGHLPGPECEIFIAQIGGAMSRVDERGDGVPPAQGTLRLERAHALASAHGRWQVRPMGARLFPRDGALRRWHGVHQLHAGRRDRPRPVSLRTKLRPAGPRQGAVRPQQLFPPESEHPTCALVN